MLDPAQQAHARLDRLLAYLEHDAANAALLQDAARTALEARAPQIAIDLFSRLAASGPLDDELDNLAGVAELQLGLYGGAAARFRALYMRAPAQPALAFNLAFALTMIGETAEALICLTPQSIDAIPAAAALQIELLHDAGRFDEALQQSTHALALHPEDAGLAAVISTLAIDCDDIELARLCAERAPDKPQALVTLGLLSLGDARNVEALALFERALDKDPRSARAWLGTGMAKLAAGDTENAARNLEHGAQLFEEHVGSRIAAGWARLILKDFPNARAHFERALAIDRNFAESHGSLAVLAMLEGRPDEARALNATALRLDPRSFSAAFARALMLGAEKRPDAAAAIMQRALETPIDETGETIAQSLVRYGLNA